MNKPAQIMLLLFICLSQTQGEDSTIPGRPNVGAASRDLVPNTLGKLAAVQFGAVNEYAHIGLIRDGKITTFVGSTLRGAMNLALRPGDIVAANEYADSLEEWKNENPNVLISTNIVSKIIGDHFFEIPAMKPGQPKAEADSAASLNGEASLPMPTFTEPKQARPKTRDADLVAGANDDKHFTMSWSVVLWISAAVSLLWVVLKRR